MRRRIVVGFAMIACLGDNFALAHHNGPYRHLSRLRRTARLRKGRFHVQLVKRVSIRDALKSAARNIVWTSIARTGFLYAFFLHASCLSYIFSFL